VLIYRLCKQRYSATVLSGEGGLQADGRWHSQGRPIVYCATSEALAVLELRVHVGNYLPHDIYVMHEITVTNAHLQVLSDAQLVNGWNTVPHCAISQTIGNDWLIQNQSAALRVPSIHSSTEFNVLLNPLHADHRKVTVKRQWPYRFDARMFAAEAARPTKKQSSRKD
jgi:RES domain-containing protein